MTNDAPRYAPSAARNRDPILEVLRRYLPKRGMVLEVASGTGEHITHFAQAGSANVVFQPSDQDPEARVSINAWVSALGLQNVRVAVALDVTANEWPVSKADAVLCINMIHVAPWAATIGLVKGSGKILRDGGMLYLYGPYRRNGRHTAPSNAAFDQDLRARHPEWGVRDLEAVSELAAQHGFAPPIIEAMPANNLSVIFRRLAD